MTETAESDARRGRGPARWPGPGPLRLLFAALAGPLTQAATPGAHASGRLLTALDGTFLDVPYTRPASPRSACLHPAAGARAASRRSGWSP